MGVLYQEISQADLREIGVAYIGDSSGSSVIDTLADPNANQCAIDAPLIKELGANTISVHYIDPNQGHGKCMQSFQDNEIYVIANMATQRDYSDVDMSGLDPSSNLVSACEKPIDLFWILISLRARVTRHGKRASSTNMQLYLIQWPHMKIY